MNYMKEVRTILFRGKRTDNGEWVRGAAVKTAVGDGYYILARGVSCKSCSVEQDTIGQYIGLEDKNGRPIYEGDIVAADDEMWSSSTGENGTEWDSWETENRFLVGWDEKICGFTFVKSIYPFADSGIIADIYENFDREMGTVLKEYCRVIGNIHDNPELLEVEEQ